MIKNNLSDPTKDILDEELAKSLVMKAVEMLDVENFELSKVLFLVISLCFQDLDNSLNVLEK